MEKLLYQSSAEAAVYTIQSDRVKATISALGATIIRLSVPDRNGVWADVALGFDAPETYLTAPGNLGATIGRYAGRIANGTFCLNGETVELTRNRGKHTIHGGSEGFHCRLWSVLHHDTNRLTLELTSPDGDQGFPGTLKVQADFTVTEGTLMLETRAIADRDTVCSITNHTYWNLAGHDRGVIDGHVLQVDADTYLETDEETIPTGQILALPPEIDLRKAKVLTGLEMDHTLARTGASPSGRLYEPVSGRYLEVTTDLPGMQIYTGDHLKENLAGKGGAIYGPRSGVCLEAQFFPDAPNHPAFPSPVLRTGEEVRHWICWRFGVAGDLP